MDNLEEVIDECDVIIDFSTREMGLKVLQLAKKHRKALVCGTTGFSSEEMKLFREAGDNSNALCRQYFKTGKCHE